MSAVKLQNTRFGVRVPVQREATPDMRAETMVNGAKKVMGKARPMLLFERVLHGLSDQGSKPIASREFWSRSRLLKSIRRGV